jgi:glycine C-acetyltransferase/8-amino-7-oxononanoate synthase
MYVMESAPGPRAVINGREVDYFCGCGYLSLQNHPELIKAAGEALKKYGMASATSRSGFGNNPVLLEVEEKASKFFGTESSLYYVSGYLGNSILLQGLRDEYDVIFVDKESHYSVIDGASVTHKPVVFFAHLDPGDLRNKTRQTLRPSERPLVICDGVFPVSGEISPLPEYLKVLEESEGRIICVDDAHAIGVLGEKGRGSFEYFGLEGEGLYFSGTLSKAAGGHGGIIAGDRDFIEKLKEKSQIPDASSPPATVVAAATAKALEILQREPGLRKKLRDNVAYAKRRFRHLGFDTDDSPVPIICLHSKRGVDLKALQLELFERRIAVFYVAPGSYSSVPQSGAIRIAIFSSHSRGQIDRLLEEIKKLF